MIQPRTPSGQKHGPETHGGVEPGDLSIPPSPDEIAAVLAVDPEGLGGIWVRSPVGPERESFLDSLQRLTPDRTVRKVPVGTSPARLFGGMDLTRTLATGTPRYQRGLLADAHGGWITLPDASGLDPQIWGPLLPVLDCHEVVCERGGFSRVDPAAFSVVALDERRSRAEGEEESGGIPSGIADRLAFWMEVPPRHLTDAAEWGASDIRLASHRMDSVEVPDECLAALVGAAAALSVVSLRAPVLALRAARARAALRGSLMANEEDVLFAVRAVLVPRGHPKAMMAPPEESQVPPDQRADTPPESSTQQEADGAETPEPPREATSTPETEPGEADDVKSQEAERLADRVLASVRASLPELEDRPTMTPSPGGQGAGGRRGPRVRAPARRGRVRSVRPGDPRDGRPLDVLATIRAAAPWQRLRGRVPGEGRLRIETGDLRVRHLEAPQVTSTIFIVDGSGSHAARRLAEAKGAVELLLARSYVRREEVGLVLFRNRGAELALPLTASLARARRVLAGLPGGGGTPLASGLDLGLRAAHEALRSGSRPRLVVLTDGKANVDLQGRGGRKAAFADALAMAARIRRLDVEMVVLDTSSRGQENTELLAAAAGGIRVRLPVANARAVDAVLGGIDEERS